MSHNLAPRVGRTTRRSAMSAIAGLIAGAAVKPTVLASPGQSRVAALWDQYVRARAELDAMDAAVDQAFDRYWQALPMVPNEIITPNPRVGHLIGAGDSEVRPGITTRLYYYKSQDLRALAVNVGPDSPTGRAALDLAEIAERYERAKTEAYRISGRTGSSSYPTEDAMIEASNRFGDAEQAVLNEPATDAADFGLKAKVIRHILDDSMAESETEDFLNQVIEFFAPRHV